VRTRISPVPSNGTQTDVTDGSLQTIVPVPVGKREGTLVMAEVIRPDEVSSAGRSWIYASVASGLLALLAFAAALPRPSGYSRRSFVSFGAGNLRRERTSRLKAEKALDRAREEEIKLKAELDREGGIVGWTEDIWSNSHSTRPSGLGGINLLAAWHLAQPHAPSPPRNPPLPGGGSHRNAIPIYEFPNERVTNRLVKRMPVRVSALRALGATANVFAIESFMDELAAAAGAPRRRRREERAATAGFADSQEKAAPWFTCPLRQHVFA